MLPKIAGCTPNPLRPLFYHRDQGSRHDCYSNNHFQSRVLPTHLMRFERRRSGRRSLTETISSTRIHVSLAPFVASSKTIALQRRACEATKNNSVQKEHQSNWQWGAQTNERSNSFWIARRQWQARCERFSAHDPAFSSAAAIGCFEPPGSFPRHARKKPAAAENCVVSVLVPFE